MIMAITVIMITTIILIMVMVIVIVIVIVMIITLPWPVASGDSRESIRDREVKLRVGDARLESRAKRSFGRIEYCIVLYCTVLYCIVPKQCNDRQSGKTTYSREWGDSVTGQLGI